ncbi:MAG: HlyD family type I secretion periplasmic adaptor subunit [Pseudomonadota bacterium]
MTTQNDFSPRLLALQDAPPSPMPRAVLWVLVALVAMLLAWATLGQLDIVARADGKLLPTSRLQVVQPLEGGRVEKILVKEGQLVSAGQVLLVMDTRLSAADTAKLQVELDMSRLQLQRMEAELSGRNFSRPEGVEPGLYARVDAQYRANREALAAAIQEQQAVIRRSRQELEAADEIRKKLAETLPIYRENESALLRLSADGYVNKISILEKQKERIEVERELSAQERTIESLQSRIGEAEARMRSIKAAYRQRLLSEHAQVKAAVEQLEQDWNKQQYRNALQELVAPQDGYVQDLATHTTGSVVPSGTVLLTLVPADEPLKAEVYLDNKDIGFVQQGQTARVKLAAYEFQRYGLLEASVESISADSVGNEDGGQANTGYRAYLQLGAQFLEKGEQKFMLRPGMVVTAEIQIGTRSVLEFLLSPISRALDEAGRER